MVSCQVPELCPLEIDFFQEKRLDYTTVVRDLFLTGKAALMVHMSFMNPK